MSSFYTPIRTSSSYLIDVNQALSNRYHDGCDPLSEFGGSDGSITPTSITPPHSPQQSPSSPYDPVPAAGVDLKVRCTHTNITGNGLRTRASYTLSVARPNGRDLTIVKRVEDFAALQKVLSKAFPGEAAALPKLPARESLISLFGPDRSMVLLRRCRCLCAYLRALLSGPMSSCDEVLECLDVAGRSSLSARLDAKRAAPLTVCTGAYSMEDVTYFKRRYAIVTSKAAFLYRHHDDDFEAILDMLEDGHRGAKLRASRLFPGKGIVFDGDGELVSKGKEVFWRIWLEGAVGDERNFSWICKGSEAAFDKWFSAIENS